MDIKILKTPDVDLAATLYALGNPIKGIHYSGRGEQMDFYFDDTGLIRQTMSDYWDKKLRIEPTELLWARREIINRVKNEGSQKLHQRESN